MKSLSQKVRHTFHYSICGSCFFLGSCTFLAVGPDYQMPAISVPGHFTGQQPEAAASSEEVKNMGTPPQPILPQDEPQTIALWWTRFQDDSLNQLIARALANNNNLQAAQARVRQARASERVVFGALLPEIGSATSYTRSKRSAKLSGSNNVFSPLGTPFNQFHAGFDASWEVDIFGGRRRAVEAASAAIDAAEAGARGTLITLLSEVARNYITLKALDKRIEVARSNIQSQKESLQLVDARFSAGIVSELDVSQARGQLENTKAALPPLESSRASSLNQLGVLLGEPAGEIHSIFQTGLQTTGSTGGALGVVPNVPVGVPSTVLRSRPDVESAERQLAQATANIGVAQSDWFPKFTIAGGYGTESREGRDLFSGGSQFWSFAPSIQWPIFSGGRIIANIDLQTERQRESYANFENTLLQAFAEVQTTLASLEQEKLRYQALRQAFDASTRAKVLSEDLYRQGLTDFLRVLDSERVVFSTEDQMVQSEGQILTLTVALYKALGGGAEGYATF